MVQVLHSKLLFRTLICGAILSASTYCAQAQAGTDSRKSTDISAPEDVVSAPSGEPAIVGKEVPVAGGVLFVTPAERASMQKEISVKKTLSNKEKRRQRRLKRTDRKEVTSVIGDSVNTYLNNVTTVTTLQRF